MSERHVIVCGAGVVGLWTALLLRRRGHAVTVLERHAEQRDGCSFGNGGFISPSHFVPLASPGVVLKALRWMLNPASPFYIRLRADLALLRWLWQFRRAATTAHLERSAPLLRDLLLRSRELFLGLDAHVREHMALSSHGELVLCRTPEAWHEEVREAEIAHRLGLETEVMDPDRLREFEPGIRLAVAGGVHYPADCRVSPPRMMAALLDEARAAGVEFQWSTPVTGWRREAGRVLAVRTTDGERRAEEFVLAAGSWSPVVARGLGLKLPIEAGKGYSVLLPDPPEQLRSNVVLNEARAFVSPQPGALRVGGTMELTGLNETLRPRRIAAILAAVRDYLPGFAAAPFEAVRPWVGLRPCSPDGLPLIGRPPAYSNLCIASGHAMLGVSLAPATGELVAAIVSGDRPSPWLEGLRPERFDR